MPEQERKLGSLVVIKTKYEYGFNSLLPKDSTRLPDSEYEVKIVGRVFEYNYYSYWVLARAATKCLHLINRSIADALITGNPDAVWLDSPITYIGQYGKWISDLEIFDVTEIKRDACLDFCTCKVCRTPIQYAEPNQPDNTFICFSCKTNPMRAYY